MVIAELETPAPVHSARRVSLKLRWWRSATPEANLFPACDELFIVGSPMGTGGSGGRQAGVWRSGHC